MTALFRGRFVVLVLSTILLFAGESTAQQFSLSGTVQDTTGVVPDAAVTLSSGGKEVSTTKTNNQGAYSFTGLPAGSYELSVARRGFETAVRNVSLGPDTAPVDVLLAMGRISTSLTITASAGKATASRLPVPDDDLPAQVSSIPQELLRQQSINSLTEGLKNDSGVQSFRWYGAYEQYLIRGFFDPDRDDANVLLLDGMRMSGNRYSTQTSNVESVEVLKGPSSILYGKGAAGGAINVVRKKPSGVRSHELSYRGGRFNTHQISGGSTGPVGSNNLFLYRMDASYEHSDGWRKAGADRLNLSPSLTWIMGERAKLTVHESFNRDRFDGDGGVPFDVVNRPDYKRDWRFDLPQDNVLVKDSQTNALFNFNLSPNLEFRDSFIVQKTSDRYFVSEYLYTDDDLVYREPLDFHHHRTPVQNQAELVARFGGFGRHTVLLGYEYQDDNYYTDTSAGDDPCTCGYWWETIAPIDMTTFQETQGPLDIDTVARKIFFKDRTHGLYWQDQIDILPKLKVNVGGRFDDYFRRRRSDYITDPSRNGIREQSESAYTYRAGVVYSPAQDHQLYFGTSSGFSFTPWGDTPSGVVELDPTTSRNYEIGHRWKGWNGRVDTNLAFYHVTRNNIAFSETPTTFIQVGEQTSKGVEIDVNTELVKGTHLLLNYGYTQPRFEDADDLDLTGNTPRFVPKHNANAWLRKDWQSGFNASFGVRYLSAQFLNNSNTLRTGGYTIFSGAVGFRAERWEWTLNAENLFNRERYFLPGNYTGLVFPGQPINVTSGIRFRFY